MPFSVEDVESLARRAAALHEQHEAEAEELALLRARVAKLEATVYEAQVVLKRRAFAGFPYVDVWLAEDVRVGAHVIKVNSEKTVWVALDPLTAQAQCVYRGVFRIRLAVPPKLDHTTRTRSYPRLGGVDRWDIPDMRAALEDAGPVPGYGKGYAFKPGSTS